MAIRLVTIARDAGIGLRVKSIFDDPKDALAYHEQHTQQRPPGGAHFESGAFELGPYNLNSRRSFDSVDTVPMHFSVPPRLSGTQLTRRHYEHVPTTEPLNRQSSRPPLPPLTHLTIPESIHRPRSGRPESSPNGIGRSPLARKSFTRLASPPPPQEAAPPMPLPMSALEVIALERESARRASEEAERRGRQTREEEARRPRKLSKQRREEGRSRSET